MQMTLRYPMTAKKESPLNLRPPRPPILCAPHHQFLIYPTPEATIRSLFIATFVVSTNHSSSGRQLTKERVRRLAVAAEKKHRQIYAQKLWGHLRHFKPLPLLLHFGKSSIPLGEISLVLCPELFRFMASSSSEQATKHEETGGEGSESPHFGADQLLLYRGLKKAKKDRGCTAKERISKMPPCTAGKRSSIYRGVTRHRWTGRYEAHLWDKSTWNQNQNKKGKQVYLGAYDDEEAAARAYDLAALKYWGPGTLINFPVTDYTRDLEEMQNVSREDYLASLRRKSSGFSRGISKYRPLSSNQWDSQFGRVSAADCINSTVYGDKMTTGGGYDGGFCIDRKIDLSSYIKWWGTNKSRQTNPQSKAFEESNSGCHEDIASELKSLEWSSQSAEPYEMPHLGVSPEIKKHKTISAMNILLKSAAYRNLQEKISKKKEKNEYNEDENKSHVGKIELENTVDKSCHDNSGNERVGVAFGPSGGLPVQRNVHQMTSLMSAPLLTNYIGIDPMAADHGLWASLVPVLPSGSSHTNEVIKNESSSDYTFFQQGG